MVLRIMIILVLILMVILYKKAAGSLSFGKINVVSLVFYFFLLQTFIGTMLINFGYDKHYTLGYLQHYNQTLQIMTTWVIVTAVMLPLMIIFFEKIFGMRDMKSELDHFLKKETTSSKTNSLFITLVAMTLFATILLMSLLIKIGYIPLIKLIHASSNFNFARERIINSGKYVINGYVTNIVIFWFIPMLSYIAFAYWYQHRDMRWGILLSILFIESIVVKTIDFEKTTALFYMSVFIMMMLFFQGGLSKRKIAGFGIMVVGSIMIMYKIMGYGSTFLDIYNGPIGRTIFTQVGTLSYSFDLFPYSFDFLHGRSLQPTVLKIIALFGIHPGEHIRSAALLMKYYGSEKVYDGVAGVMNSLFIGEAYANWGYLGCVISIIWVAFVIAMVVFATNRLKKTPITVMFSAYMAVKVSIIVHGGFVDFIYNLDIIMATLVMITVYVLFEKNGLDRIVESIRQHGCNKG